MDILNLKNQLQSSAPEELYNIEPGQITFFVPRNGFGLGYSAKATDIISFISPFVEDKEVKLNVVSTDNQLLIGNLAGRNIGETDVPFKVVVGPFEAIYGFTAEYLGIPLDTVKQRGKSPDYLGDIVVEDELPIIITISRAVKPIVVKQIESTDYYDSPLEQLQAKPEPGSKEEKELIKSMEEKLDALLRECYVLDIDLDIDKVKNDFDKNINSDIDYQLIIKAKFHQSGIRRLCDFCDIYVADGEKYKLNFTAAQKAVYLTFLLYGEKGLRIAETFGDFRETCKKIYWKLPFNERCDTTAGGMSEDENADIEVYLSTLRTYLSKIRNKVARKVLNPKTAIEFAIEGYKDEAYSIRKSNKEIRAQIKEWFSV